MVKKRLDRDQWGFGGFPYAHMRVDTDEFHGMVSVLDLLDGQTVCWSLPRAGATPVCGKGMRWLQLIPDGQHRVITAKFLPEPQRSACLPCDKRVSVWYVDVIDGWGYDTDQVIYFNDCYLDVIFDLEGDVTTDDRDELDAAYASGELSAEQYQRAIAEGDAIIAELCADVSQTQAWCETILRHALQRIDSNDRVFRKPHASRRAGAESGA